MASRGIVMGLVLVLAATLWNRSAAQSGCATTLMTLAPCLNFITANSSAPSSACCSQLASVVQGSPQCLCSVMNATSPMFGITINQTQALALPKACNVQTPPVSQCNAVANAPTPASVGAPEAPPVATPSDSPAEPSDETPTAAAPAASSPPSGAGGSKAVPSTNGNASSGSIVKAQLHLAALVVLVASIFKRL
ncbi:AAI domain-containing protein [Psidium guajava]|nr:AAI domain-containing protein [Psidium guajava]